VTNDDLHDLAALLQDLGDEAALSSEIRKVCKSLGEKLMARWFGNL
jgi:hypothetical protein